MVGSAADKATGAVGQVAKKAKVPLMAGGAALAGAAGGLALGARSHRGKGIGKALSRRPKVKVGPRHPLIKVPRRSAMKVRSKDLANAAKDMGSFGAQLGQLAGELQQVRESSNGGKQHQRRSPVEVVLQGLTARR